jgi:hypothetical protein
LQVLRARQLEIKVVLGGPALGEKEMSVSFDKERTLREFKIAAAISFGIKMRGHDGNEEEEAKSDLPDLLDAPDQVDTTAQYVRMVNEKYPDGVAETDMRLREYNFTYK